MTIQTSIEVDYKFAEDWHVFSSEALPGLYVASRNAETAYSDVPVAIQKLLFLDEGLDCVVKPEQSFREFIAKTQEDDGTLAMKNKRFGIVREMAHA